MDDKPPPKMCLHMRPPDYIGPCSECAEEQAWLKKQEDAVARRMGERVDVLSNEERAIKAQHELLGPVIHIPEDLEDRFEKHVTGVLKVECNEFLFKWLPGTISVERLDGLAFHLLVMIENEWKIEIARQARKGAKKP